MNNPIKLRGSVAIPPWSSERLSEMYPRFASTGLIGESWETSAARDSSATVLDTEEFFCDFIKKNKLPIPPLVKLISAKSPLSIQVHPDETAAKKHCGIAKSEIWYVLDAEADASLLYGTKPEVSITDVLLAITDKNVSDLLNCVSVSPGDVIMIPPGMIHSLGGGVTVLEVQDRIGTTYRLQDLSGDRETHPSEAMDSIKLYSLEEAAALAITVDGNVDLPGDVIASTEGFTVTSFSGNTAIVPSGGVYMFCVNGDGYAGNVTFSAGDSLFFTDVCKVGLSDSSLIIFVK